MSQISVIIPTYNRAKYLPRAIESVLGQTHTDLELIIVDDASTDETQAYINSLADNRIRVILHSKNLGVSSARNTGIKAAKNNWIAFLDSDDEWLPHKLKTQLEFIKNNPGIKAIHSNEQWVYNGDKKAQPKKYKRYSGWIFDKCISICCVGPSTSLVHKDVFEDVGLFNEAFPVCEDYDLWLRVSHKYELGLTEDILVNKYGGHEDQLSITHHELDYWRVKALEPFIFDEGVFGRFSSEVQAIFRNIMLQKYDRLLTTYSKQNNEAKLSEIKAKLSEIMPK